MHASQPSTEGLRGSIAPPCALLFEDARGANLIEYLILVGAIAIVAIAGFRLFGERVGKKAERHAACVASLGCDPEVEPYTLAAGSPPGQVTAASTDGVPLIKASLSAMAFKAMAAPVAYAAVERPPLLPPPPGGLDASKVGVVLNDDPSALPTAAQLGALGVTSARISLNQGNFTGDAANLRAWSEKLADYRAANIEIVINTPREFAGDFPPHPPGWQWHSGEPIGDAWKAQFETWKNEKYLPRLESAVTALGPYAHGFEVWNEPDELDNRPGYAPAMPPEVYGALLRDARAKIQAGPARPDGTKPLTITAGMDSGQVGYLQDAAKATGGVLYADAIGLHPYDKQPQLPATDPQSLAKILGEYSKAEFTTPNGTGPLPVYVTEASQPSHDPDDMLTYVNNAAIVTNATPGVSKTYLFWRDSSDGHPGLVVYAPGESGKTATPTPTPAYQQLATLLGKDCAPNCVVPAP